MAVLGPRKSIEETLAATEVEGRNLERRLSATDLVVLGVGVMIGAGIFVLVGEAAADGAGPSITLSFVLAAVVCALAALCYAELASMVPAAGSAYTYAFATVGQLIAFIIGWDLVLEFTIGASAVAVGFAGNLNGLLGEIPGAPTLPDALINGPFEGGVVNVFAVAIVLFLGVLLVRGVKIAARANTALVVGILAVLLFVIVVGGTQVDTVNWSPFLPEGFGGIVAGASLVFFAYIGFDVVATAAEETKRPQRDMPVGILGSLAIVTVLYVLVALVVTGMVPFAELASDAPVADAFKATGTGWAAIIIYVGALVATLNTVLVLMLGQTRVAFAMGRDGLFPRWIGVTHPRFRTPSRVTWITTAVVAVLAGTVPLTTLAELVNIGTLFAFALVAVAVLYLRYAEPTRDRAFRTPLVPVVPILAIAGCVYLASSLPAATWVRFGIWMAIGLVVYVAFSRRMSRITEERADEHARSTPGGASGGDRSTDGP